ncbi:MAG: shikimate kinase [Actinomycetaceae bacterium]|nr:shikimate kinase [Actinomycetaceae bacterium]
MEYIIFGVAGAGKTALAQALAEATALPVIELDEEVARVAGQPVGQILVREGTDVALRWQRELAEQLLSTLPDEDDTEGRILVLGPEVVTQPQIQKILSDNSTSRVLVEVTADLDTLMRRTGLNAPRTVGFGPLRRTFATMVDSYRQAWDGLEREIMDTTTIEASQNAASLLALVAAARYSKAD